MFRFLTYFILRFYCCSVIVVLIFSPLLSPPLPTPTAHLESSPAPLCLSLGHFYMFLDNPPSCFPHYRSSPSPLVTVNLFFISMSLLCTGFKNAKQRFLQTNVIFISRKISPLNYCIFLKLVNPLSNILNP